MKIRQNTLWQRLMLLVLIVSLTSFTETKDAETESECLAFELRSERYEIAPFDAGKMTLEKAVMVGNVLVINGKSGWRLPSREELDMIYKTAYKKRTKLNGKIVYYPNHHFKGVDGFYWTSDKPNENAGVAYVKSFYNGKINTLPVESEAHIRFIRLIE